jgi:hypothetical protein
MQITFEGREIYALRDALHEASGRCIDEYRKGQADKSVIEPLIMEWSAMLRKMGFTPTMYVTRCFPEA